MSEFSDWLDAEMKSRNNLSEHQLSRMSGVQHTTISSWRKGHTTLPDWFNLGNLADALSMPRDWVRRLAGYVDPDEPEHDEDLRLREIEATWARLDERDRQVMLRLVRGLRETTPHPNGEESAVG